MVYVDPLHGSISGDAPKCFTGAGRACHLYADTLEELHIFAMRIGMKRSWFQDSGSLQHSDLVPSKRDLAVKYGAVEQSRKSEVEKWRELRQKRIENP